MISIIIRITLLFTGHMSGYVILKGIEEMSFFPALYYTIAFGILLLSCLFLLIFGVEIINATAIIEISAIISLSMSLAVISSQSHFFHYLFLTFSILGFLGIFVNRWYGHKKSQVALAKFMYLIAGSVILFLPLILSYLEITSPRFAITGLGCLTIGIAGIYFSKQEKIKTISGEKKLQLLTPFLFLQINIFFLLGIS